MINNKIKKLENQLLDNYKVKIDELLSCCESPIEKLLLLQLFNYFDSFEIKGRTTINKQDYDIKKFDNLQFITNCIDPNVSDISKIDREKLLLKIKKNKYRSINFQFEKITGFRAVEGQSEAINSKNNQQEPIYREFKVYTQYETRVGEFDYRIDIAILIVRREINWSEEEGKIINTKKVAIECNGYQFHSTPEQQTNFEKRKRNLESDGWHVISYSGSEIFRNEDADKFFKEIIDIVFNK